MLEPMFYPIWKLLPRPRFFPDDPTLDRLLGGDYDPKVGPFKAQMKRRHARDLRKGLFGPEGLRNVPDRSGGVMEFDLPKGWTLRLIYYAAGDYDFEHRLASAGDVGAEFIPPQARQQLRRPHEGISLTAQPQ
jgi:hypothetical protein